MHVDMMLLSPLKVKAARDGVESIFNLPIILDHLSINFLSMTREKRNHYEVLGCMDTRPELVNTANLSLSKLHPSWFMSSWHGYHRQWFSEGGHEFLPADLRCHMQDRRVC